MTKSLPQAVLLDTSVLLRFFSNHRDRDQPAAEQLLEAFLDGRAGVVLLDLSIYEFVNILVRRLGRAEAAASKDVDALFSLGAPVYPVDRELARSAASIAARSGLSGYDAAFLAASDLLGLPLVTGDRGIIERAGDRHVIALSSLS